MERLRGDVVLAVLDLSENEALVKVAGRARETDRHARQRLRRALHVHKQTAILLKTRHYTGQGKTWRGVAQAWKGEEGREGRMIQDEYCQMRLKVVSQPDLYYTVLPKQKLQSSNT